MQWRLWPRSQIKPIFFHQSLPGRERPNSRSKSFPSKEYQQNSQIIGINLFPVHESVVSWISQMRFKCGLNSVGFLFLLLLFLIFFFSVLKRRHQNGKWAVHAHFPQLLSMSVKKHRKLGERQFCDYSSVWRLKIKAWKRTWCPLVVTSKTCFPIWFLKNILKERFILKKKKTLPRGM